MLEKIEHIGIAVKDAKSSVALFNALFNREPLKTETVTSESVTTIFYQLGESKIELLEATSEDSTIARFIEKRGEGIHHIAFAVDNLETEIERLKTAGFQFIHDAPKDGADNKRICFLHPKSGNGILIELCEERK
ncbi:MAG: methylmalonyl-CoA epimerase [Bacteroidia bacterium]